MTKIKINSLFWLIILLSIVTGQFIEIITLFSIVVIHELGHVFAAKSYGWDIIEIQLLPFGGVATVKQKKESNWEEFIVAISGPLQNVIMIFITIIFSKLNLWSQDWAIFFIKANTTLLLFNLLPISPLDGSRIMKVILYPFFSFKKVIMISIFISILVNIIFLFWASGIFLDIKPNLNGILFGLFFCINIFFELRRAPYMFWDFILHRLNLEGFRNLSVKQIVVQPEISILKSLQLLYKGRYHLFYVISADGKLMSIIPEEKVINYAINNKEINKPIDNLI